MYTNKTIGVNPIYRTLARLVYRIVAAKYTGLGDQERSILVWSSWKFLITDINSKIYLAEKNCIFETNCTWTYRNNTKRKKWASDCTREARRRKNRFQIDYRIQSGISCILYVYSCINLCTSILIHNKVCGSLRAFKFCLFFHARK